MSPSFRLTSPSQGVANSVMEDSVSCIHNTATLERRSLRTGMQKSCTMWMAPGLLSIRVSRRVGPGLEASRLSRLGQLLRSPTAKAW